MKEEKVVFTGRSEPEECKVLRKSSIIILMRARCYYLSLLFGAYPQFKFKPSKIFSWYAAEQRICFINCKKSCRAGDQPCTNFYKLAHELGHAKLKHEDYKTKIELNRMELAAWAEAEKIIEDLSLKNNLSLAKIPEDIIDSAMDSYVNNAGGDECEKCELSLIGGVCPNCSIN